MTPQQRQVIAHHAARIVDAHRAAVRHEMSAARLHTCRAKIQHAAKADAYGQMLDSAVLDITRAINDAELVNQAAL